MEGYVRVPTHPDRSFRPIVIAPSGRSWSPIPAHRDHPFRGSWSPIPTVIARR